MSSVVHEEFAPYLATPRGLPEESLQKAEAGVDWEGYERQSEIDLREAVAAYQAGERGVPARAFFDELLREDELEVAGA